MRPENNPLDLNNFPDDITRDGKQVLDESSSSGNRRKKNGGKEEDSGKVYECRFCSLKFCKSQALGGHMNRHRQERETETLYRARQLVFGNDGTLASQGPPIGCQAIPGGYIPTGHIGDPTLPYRSVYPPPRYFSGSSSILHSQPPQPQQPYLYSSPSRLMSYSSQYPHQQPSNDYCIGHVLGGSSSQYSTSSQQMVAPESNYTCIGAPVGHGFIPSTDRGNGRGRGSELGGDGGLNWGRGYTNAGSSHSQQRLDPSSMINRYQDGF